ncbi:MAG: PAS domain-containing protein, partial [Spirochaetaceae bacterium]|nr:PAS domain-containing protein [Spirochaetaceae bacterium]
TYRKENKELKKLLRRFRRSFSNPETARSVLKSISEVEKHYARKENQLFPYLEEVDFTGPSKVMWGKHDEIRELLKNVSDDFTRRKGRSLITSMKRMIFMEEKILFPTALRKLPDATWKKVRRGENEIGYAWIKPGSLWDPDVIPTEPTLRHPTNDIELSVGRLLPDQIDLMLRNLPLDVTYVDENDRVRYYSQGKERIFPRSPGIIGREVQNCHPPKSVHVVQKIVDDFKNRRRSEAEFWIQMGGKFIHIRYFPLFDKDVYRGVLEVSQDLTPLRELQGEKRLLDDESSE